MIKRLLILTTIGFFLWILAGYLSAKYLTRTNQIQIKNIDSFEGLDVLSLSIETSDHITVSSWYIENSKEKVIILLSGIKGNRTGQLKRAKFYLNNGYSVLLPDLRGTGKTKGNFISFGWHESKDLIACYKKLKQMGFTKISANGQSLGAATIVYSIKNSIDFDFIILESCYDNITNAFENRVKNYPVPKFLYKPIIYFTETIIEEPQSSLTPDTIISEIDCPTLILAGDSELQIPKEETERIFSNCKAKTKQLHFFKNGRHEDLYNKFPSEFEKIVTGFIKYKP